MRSHLGEARVLEERLADAGPTQRHHGGLVLHLWRSAAE